MTMPNTLTPDPTNPDPSLTPSLESIPPTPTPNVSPTNDDNSGLNPILLESLRESNRQLAKVQAELAEARKPVPPSDNRTPDEIRAAWFDNPEKVNRQVVREEVQATIAPLMEFVATLKRDTVVDQSIANFKSDPRLAPQFDADVERFVRSELGKLDPSRINNDITGAIVLGAIGMKATGMIKSTIPNLSTPPQPLQDMRVTPPHIRADPLPITPPNPSNQPNVRPLSEHEKRLLRELNQTRRHPLTEADYVALTELPADQVANSTIGVPKDKK